MSHHHEKFTSLKTRKGKFENNIVTLPIAGQGVIIFSPKEELTTLELTAPKQTKNKSKYKYFSLTVNKSEYSFHAAEERSGEKKELLFSCNKGYEQYPKGPYWFSIDFENRLLKVGYGEPRAELVLFSYRFSKCGHKKGENGTKKGSFKYEIEKKKGNLGPNLWPSMQDNPEVSPYKWLKELDKVKLTGSEKTVTIFRDPITIEAPMVVKDTNHITMGDASKNLATVPVNLPSVCQKLYENVGGKNFNLKNINKDFDLHKDFDFAKAVQYSIDTEGKICDLIIKNKVGEFGDDKMVYLRITMGGNQGESPGIPYVMEIWPSGKKSPIHNHGGSEAIIKVLHGQIKCSLFPTLTQAIPIVTSSKDTGGEVYASKAFKDCEFHKGEVTYITPWLNQIHQLENTDPVNACITIQCYGYPEGNFSHYEYFNWLNTNHKKDEKDENEIDSFFPDSDYNFNEFVIDIYNEYMYNHIIKKTEKHN